MQLDPRTLSRRHLLERPGFTRPDVSIVLPATDTPQARIDMLDAFALDQGLHLQVVRFGGAKTSEPVATRNRSLSLLFVSVGLEDSPVAAINKAGGAAIGRLIVFGPSAPKSIAAAIDRFSNDPWLGVIRDKEPVPPMGPFSTGVAVRGDLWMAFDGLDDAFETVEWAFEDFLLRARTIGFATPPIEYAEPFEPHPDLEADRDLFQSHAQLAPDRSGAKRPQATPPVRPDRLTVYTAITDGYDSLKPQLPSAVGGSPLVAFLDQATTLRHNGQFRGWQPKTAQFPEIGARRASRFFKANAHLALPESRYSLWIDASVSLVAPFDMAQLADMFLADCDLCVFRHHARQSIREEAEACKALGLDAPDTIDRQVDRYRREGLPDDTGLAELPIILRRHSRAVEAFDEAWWEEIAAGSWRDQLSFNYVIWKTGLPYATFPLSLVIQNGLFVKFRRPLP
ncbi:glycosyltransferase domain-containing protein [Oricola sp.]|uniref:glycosyltransferase domain-containing protein n=1 Tax=Oricola sp. TaxID=1979950 RepID=UPI0025EB45B2|nr:glycosyltransferase domain-containing protein [Oricola sp.]MCI5078377.1 DUF616 domain-containing protein [Oricola sp.]